MTISDAEMNKRLIDAEIAEIMLRYARADFSNPSLSTDNCSFTVVKNQDRVQLCIKPHHMKGSLTFGLDKAAIGPAGGKTEFSSQQQQVIEDIANQL